MMTPYKLDLDKIPSYVYWFTHHVFLFCFFWFVCLFCFVFFLNIEAYYAYVQYLYLRILKKYECEKKQVAMFI